MNNHTTLEDVANEYRLEGYQVEVSPPPDRLPAFLTGFPIDLIARKDGENVVVGVRTRRELTQEVRLAELADRVNAQPGWRFDLAVRRPPDHREGYPNGAAGPSEVKTSASPS